MEDEIKKLKGGIAIIDFEIMKHDISGAGMHLKNYCGGSATKNKADELKKNIQDII